MASTHRQSALVARRARMRLVEDVERLASDAGVSHAALARAAGISSGYLADLMSGRARPSLETYAKLAVPLGADLAARLYPNTGPIVRDRHQGRILEELIALRHPRWTPYTELAVRQPARGWIDVAFHEEREQVIVATEIESGLRRVEQLVRWSIEKAESLPSWSGWGRLGEPPAVSRLLLVRRTRATRDVGRDFEAQLRIAYPAHPEDAVAALTGTNPWPGPALVWVSLDAGRVRLHTER